LTRTPPPTFCLIVSPPPETIQSVRPVYERLVEVVREHIVEVPVEKIVERVQVVNVDNYIEVPVEKVVEKAAPSPRDSMG